MMISRLHNLDNVMKGKMGSTQQNTTSMHHVIWRWKFDLCFTYTYYVYVFKMYFWQTFKFGKICRENVECSFKDV
jgi:hypothetical protein